MIRLLLIVIFYLNSCNSELYDAYHGTPLTELRRSELLANGAADSCIIEIAPCDVSEGRRVDGTCNHVDNPARGGFNTPQIRLVPAVYDENFEQTTTTSGKPYMLPRRLRQMVMKVGKAVSPRFAQSMSYFAEFCTVDTISVHDIDNYIYDRPYCCEEQGKTDYFCTPNYIPADDSTHQFSGLRCMNQTRPLSFQNQGCVANNTTPERFNLITVAFDLSVVYYLSTNSTPFIRTYSGGLLKTEVVNGKIFPSDGNSSCTLEMFAQTRCTRKVPNLLIGSNFYSNLFWRQHNYFASNLALVNPDWDDEKLFTVAKDINIAYYSQIVYYEFYPALIGRDNLVEKGIISEDPGFRDPYDPNVDQQLILEFPFSNRWFHYLQEGKQKLYDTEYNYLNRTVSIVDFSNHIEKFAEGDIMTQMTIGSFLQPGGEIDDVVDPDIAERAVGTVQHILDLGAQDINKGRLFGLAPYIQYRRLRCNYTKSYETFEDLADSISEANLRILKEIYEVPEDIELMSGMIMENLIPGGYIPETVAFITMAQLKLSITTDRHWYERADRPNAFTLEQLHQIRKSSLAGLYCNVGDGVTRIQRNAFLTITAENPLVDCSEIPKINFDAWKEVSDDDYDV